MNKIKLNYDFSSIPISETATSKINFSDMSKFSRHNNKTFLVLKNPRKLHEKKATMNYFDEILPLFNKGKRQLIPGQKAGNTKLE